MHRISRLSLLSLFSILFAVAAFAGSSPRYLHGEFHEGVVRLSWSAPDEGGEPQAYAVYKSSNSTTFTRIGSTEHTAFEDADVVTNKFYLYKVTAIRHDTVESGPSNIVGVLTRDPSFAAPPRHLEADFENSAVALTWRRPESNVPPSFYKVYRSAGWHVPEFLVSTPDTQYSDTAITLRTLYHYAVTAVHQDTVESLPSNIVEVYTGDRESEHVAIHFTTEPPHLAVTGRPYSYDADAVTDPPGHTITFRLGDAPDGMTIDTATGLVQWTPSHAGCFEVEVKARVRDSLYGDAEQEFRLFVLSGIPGSVGGTVHNSSGEPLRYVHIKLFDVARGEFVLRTQTDDSGKYLFPVVNPATYYVRAKSENRRYLSQWYDGASRIEDATAVVVPESTAVRANFTLVAKDTARDIFTLSGTVMDTGSAPIARAKVYITRIERDRCSDDRFDDDNEEDGEHGDGDHNTREIRYAVTDSAGHYTLRLHGGTYLVAAFAEHYRPQFWDHAANPLDADRLHLTADTSGIDFNLSPKMVATGSISGFVLSATDDSPVEAHVIGFRKDSSGHFTHFSMSARTDTNGAYTLEHLPNGSYIVLAKDEHEFIPTFYNTSGGTPYLDSATAVVVTGANVADITIHVSPDSVHGLNSIGGAVAMAASTTGTAPLEGAMVTIAGADGKIAATATSERDGIYLATGLAPGTYNVTFQKPGSLTASVPATIGYQHNAPTTTTINAQLSGDGGTGRLGVMSLRSQWNLISLPVDVADAHRSVLFPSAVSNAFTFSSGGYRAADILSASSGYWLKFTSIQITAIDGSPRTSQTIPVTAGWNLIGSLSTQTGTANIQTSPPGILGRNFFGYTGGYSIASSIEPGKGYWVKANAAGTITLVPGQAEGKSGSFTSQLNDLNSVTIRDAGGNAQTLWFGAGSFDLAAAELPPSPPEGVFDVRFASQRFAELHASALTGERIFPILVRGASGPLTVSWATKSSSLKYTIASPSGKMVLAGSGTSEMAAPGTGLISLSVQPSENPKEFSLRQNYPNPFNPVTTIAFDLPEASTVTLKIYNIIGQEIAAPLENVAFEAGRQAVTFDASRYGSGMYFYRIQAGNYSSVRKMMYVK